MTSLLASDTLARAPKPEDAQSILDLIVASDVASVGQSNFELRSLLNDWGAPDFDLTKDAQVIVTAQGVIIGYALIYDVNDKGRIQFDSYRHPQYANQGIDSVLLRWVASRAHERAPEIPDGIRVCTQTTLFGIEPSSHRFFQAEGYSVIRHFWRMEIDLVEPPAAAQWPNGITVRTFVPGQDEHSAWQAMNEIFEGDWEYVPTSFEDWVAAKIANAPFDPTLWHLAMAGDQIAGMARGMYRQDNGWIRTLGVCKPWRRQGLAIALLHHSFGEFYRRGKRNIGLGVDTQNPTGATRLYERAGMHIAQVFDTYEKELRAGKSVT